MKEGDLEVGYISTDPDSSAFKPAEELWWKYPIKGAIYFDRHWAFVRRTKKICRKAMNYTKGD